MPTEGEKNTDACPALKSNIKPVATPAVRQPAVILASNIRTNTPSVPLGSK